MFFVLFILIGYCIAWMPKDKAVYHLYNLFITLTGQFILIKYAQPWDNLIYHIVPFMTFVPLLRYFNKYAKWFMGYLGIAMFYCIFKSLFWNFDIIQNMGNYRFVLCIGGAFLSIYEDFKHGRFSRERFVKGFYIIFLIEVLLCLVQLVSHGASVFFYADRKGADYGAEELSALSNGMNLVSGTLNSVPGVAQYLTLTIYTFAIYDWFHKSERKSGFFILLLSVATLFLTGIRTPFMMLAVMVLTFTFFYKRLFFLIGLIPVALLFTMMQLDVFAGMEGALGRMFQGFSQIQAGGDAIEATTFALTIFMVPYFMQNPIFGVSLQSSSGYYLSNYPLMNDFSTTDVELLFQLCETGIVGVLIYLIPYFRLRKMVGFNINRRLYNLIICLCLLLSIVDPGIYSYVNVVVMIYCFVVIVNLDVDQNNVKINESHNKC